MNDFQSKESKLTRPEECQPKVSDFTAFLPMNERQGLGAFDLDVK
jgi:hypothetical protein